MSWKDFLYFRKGSRVGVILLLILILLALLLNVLLSYRGSSPFVVMQNDSIIREFDAFLRTLQPNVSPLGETTGPSSGMAGSRTNDATGSGSDSVTGSHLGLANESAFAKGGSSHADAERLQAVSDDVIPGTRSERVDHTRYPRYPRVEKLSEGETISLNSTDTAEWKKVPGIGTVYASRIVKYRERLGGFARKEQLLEVYGVDSELYARIAPYIQAGGNWRKVGVNQLGFKELLNHPYLSYRQVQAIVNLRRRKGRIDSIQELGMLDEFTSDDIYRLEPYLEF